MLTMMLLLVETNLYINNDISWEIANKYYKVTHSFENLTCFLKLYGDTDICFSAEYKRYPGK